MIVLDTNVVSELMRDSPQQTVRAWFSGKPASSLYVTTVTEAEILTGIALLSYGRRRYGLSEAAARVFAALFAGRILFLIVMQRTFTPKSLPSDTQLVDP